MQSDLIPIQDETFYHGVFLKNAELDRKVTFSLMLRPKTMSYSDRQMANELLTCHPCDRNYLGHAEVAGITSYSDEDKDEVVRYLSQFTYKENEILRELIFSGCVADFETAFNCKVGVYKTDEGAEFLSAVSSVLLPSHLADLIYSFDGFSQTIRKEDRKPTDTSSDDDGGWSKGFSISEISSAYEFPKGVTGKGQTIGIVELGGVYKSSDLELFFEKIEVPMPKIEVVGHQPGGYSETNNCEVTMDLQIAGAIAPDAKIVIYYAKTFIEALKLIISDNVHRPSVVSISWSSPEEYYNDSEKREFDQLFYQAALLGITIIGSSGDHGAYNSLDHLNVPLPACHPLVLGCGGTTINIENGKRIGEIVWNEFHGDEVTGGGFSDSYDIPDYQKEAIANYNFIIPQGRGVPDVSALSSTIDGFQVVFEGLEVVVGGTSTATPMWAGLIALINQKLGYNVGFINTILYKMAGTTAFYSIEKGNNLLYKAAPFWNPCTGLGTPNGIQIIEQIETLEN